MSHSKLSKLFIIIIIAAFSNNASPLVVGANDAASCGSTNAYKGKEHVQVHLHGSIVVVCVCCLFLKGGVVGKRISTEQPMLFISIVHWAI